MKKKMMNEVEKYLREMPSTRDNDELLCANIWYEENLKKFPPATDLLSFLLSYSQGGFSPAENITRARRKVQEVFPELRGTKYIHRKLKATNWKPSDI